MTSLVFFSYLAVKIPYCFELSNLIRHSLFFASFTIASCYFLVLGPLAISVYSHCFDNLTCPQANSFKSYPYANDSHFYFQPNFLLCLIYPFANQYPSWMSNRLLKLNMFKTAFLLPKSFWLIIFPISIEWQLHPTSFLDKKSWKHLWFFFLSHFILNLSEYPLTLPLKWIHNLTSCYPIFYKPVPKCYHFSPR